MERIQRKRTKGWRIPENTIYVGRGTKWGNPFNVDVFGREYAIEMYRDCLLNNALAYRYFLGNKALETFEQFKWISKHINELEGNDLACWCPLDKPCHADVLIEFYNRQKAEKINTMKIYIASSWKNQHSVEMLTSLLREKGHVVASFVENNYEEGFGASKGIPFEEWIKTPSAELAFTYDTSSAATSDLTIYISPSGKDAAAEVGIAWANKKPVLGLYAKGEDFGLMRKMVTTWFERYPDLLANIERFNPTVQKD